MHAAAVRPENAWASAEAVPKRVVHQPLDACVSLSLDPIVFHFFLYLSTLLSSINSICSEYSIQA